MSNAATISDNANYTDTLLDAAELLTERLPSSAFPSGEMTKAANDALNNVWIEGMTVGEWVEAAAARLSVVPSQTQKISARILANVAAGMDLPTAIDAVLGAGEYEAFVSSLYAALRSVA